MQRISELHEQAATILSAANDCLTEIGYIQQGHDNIERQEELKKVYFRAYRMAMRSYIRCIDKIKEEYELIEK